MENLFALLDLDPELLSTIVLGFFLGQPALALVLCGLDLTTDTLELLVVGSQAFGDDFEVFMTEKDAVKLGRGSKDKFWYVPVELTMDPVEAAPLLEQIESRLRARQQ